MKKKPQKQKLALLKDFPIELRQEDLLTMGNVVVTMFYSLDGVMEEPAWTMPYWNDEIAEFKSNEFAAAEAHLLGRVTYESFAAVWPLRAGELGADTMNNLPKYVVSTSLEKADWNNSHIIKGNLAEEVNKAPVCSNHDFSRAVARRTTAQKSLPHRREVHAKANGSTRATL